MASRRINTADLASRSCDTAGGRMRWLLHNVWEGNCSAMAKAVGISPSMVNRIDHAGREPGRRVMEAVAAYPKLNRAWVLTGEGEPVRSVAVAVVDRPLPGPPRKHSSLLTGSMEPLTVSPDSMYWLRLQ